MLNIIVNVNTDAMSRKERAFGLLSRVPVIGQLIKGYLPEFTRRVKA